MATALDTSMIVIAPRPPLYEWIVRVSVACQYAKRAPSLTSSARREVPYLLNRREARLFVGVSENRHAGRPPYPKPITIPLQGTRDSRIWRLLL